VARDRKRAKQRRDRSAAGARRAGATPAPGDALGGSNGASSAAATASEDALEHAPAPGSIQRSDLPGALDHAGAEVDEFDAALVAGAGGAPSTQADEREFDAEVDDALQEPSGPGGGAGGAGSGGGSGGAGGGGDVARPSGAPLRGGNRAIGFLRASWAELQRVQWPDRRQVTQATAVVIGFVAVAGVYLGVADTVAKEIVEFIL
jgi:preprotein translocase SecE subunit